MKPPSFQTLFLSVALAAATLTLPARADESLSADEAAGLANRYVQPTLSFKPCAENPTLDCATLRVPVNYRKPWEGQIGLAVIRARATSPARRIGVLFANPGGPGGSGVDFVAQGVQAPGFIRLRERFDIVSFDVRGSSRSQAVRCDLPALADPATVPAAQLPALFDGFSRDVAAACLRQNGGLVASLSSNNMARDLDVLRRSLNERQISYVGLSHGTVLGAVYASMFPRNLRAMLLDGGVTPDFEDGKLDFRATQALSFETVFQRLDQLCRADAACRLRDLGVSAAMQELVGRLVVAPVTSGTGLVLDGATLRVAVARLLSNETLWPFIVDGLADARGGNFTLMFQLMAFVGISPPAGQTILTAQNAILCNEFSDRRPAAEYLPVSEAVTAVSSRIDARFSVATSVSFCAQWPQADVPLIRSVRGLVATPILLIGTQFDPNTPLAWTRALAGALGMERHVLRYQGGGHTAYGRFGNACVDGLGDAYLFDLSLPTPGASCAARPVRFRPAAGQGLLRAGAAAGIEPNWWPVGP